MLIKRISLALVAASLVACGSSSDSDPADDDSQDSSQSSSSSSPPTGFTGLPLIEDFDHVVDAEGFFSEGYKALVSSNDPLYYSLSGTPVFADGQITLPGARFSIGNTQPDVQTTATDTEVHGEFDLTRPYRVSFCILDAEVTGDNHSLMVYVDNNTTSAGESIHGGGSRLISIPVDTLEIGRRVFAVSDTLGTENSFIQIRTESGATVTFDDLWIGYQDESDSEPGLGSCGDHDDDGLLLPQTNNPAAGQLNRYRSWLSSSGSDEDRLEADKTRADNMITWQMDHGGFDKHNVSVYDEPWDGTSSRSGWTGAGGTELGTIDNDATITHLMFLADVYQRTGDEKYREAAQAALGFMVRMQYESGGWPQVYPERPGSYSNEVTFNDNAMTQVLILFDHIERQVAPLDGDLFTEPQIEVVSEAIEKGIDYILNAQIEQDGVKTVWGQQHDPVTYEPTMGRDYEWPSKTANESVLVVGFLMSRPQTPEIEAAVKAALAWYRDPEVQVADTAYVNRPSGSDDDSYNPIREQPGSTMWYRFYDVDQNVGFFSGRQPPGGEGKQYDIMDIEPERRYGYQWGGSYGNRILPYADSVGY
ncbi:pectate lyase [Marinimicrobium alkaliphilum]|uniref:pectate lyase n=1 Tax=Marinimicrobium alkaliphilum TaxID=2202654 RepID=UPI0018E0B033|nr:pectate lyase [Marinimicrobium alkaliphilum]